MAARGLRAGNGNAVLARVLDGYEHIQQYDPRDKNLSPDAAPDQDFQPAGTSFAVYFLSGIAAMMALMAVSYGMTLLMAKLGWTGRESEEDDVNNGADADAEPSWKRMTVEERRRVLDTALEAQPHSSFRAAQKADGDDDKKIKCIDESSSDDSDDGDSCIEESESSITSVGGRQRRCTSRRRDNDQDGELDTTSHIHSDQQNETSESHVACSICLEEYQAEDEVIIGLNCIHMFHKDCAIDWLEKQEVCPCCREKMVCDERMAEAAPTILGAERMQELEKSGGEGATSIEDEFEAEQRIVIPAW